MRNPTTILFICLVLSSPVAGQARSSAPDFSWSESVSPGQSLEVRNLNGPVTVTRAVDGRVALRASRTADRSDPDSVRITVTRDSQGVIACALYPGQDASDCTRRGGSHYHSDQDNDVRVAFTVSLPAGVAARLLLVNGSVDARGLVSPIDANVVNGNVAISTSSYARARTVNGSITVSMGDPGWPGDALAFASVNGAIDVTIPPSTSARVHFKTLSGSISSDFGIARHDGPFGIMQSADGTIGSGKRQLDLTTINGSIRLTRGP